MSNFSFLHQDWPILEKIGRQAELYVYTDPNASMVKVRQLSEFIIDAIVDVEQLEFDDHASTFDKLKELGFINIIDEGMQSIFHEIRKIGNKATHTYNNSPYEAMLLLKHAHFIAQWFVSVYGDESIPYVSFEAPPEGKQVETVDTNFAKQVPAQSISSTAMDELEQLRREKEQLLQEIAALQAGKTVPFEKQQEERRVRSREFIETRNLTEKETRIYFIDAMLRDAGWEADSEKLTWANGARPAKGRNMAIAEVPTLPFGSLKGRPEADYALFIGTELVGVIEAKKFDVEIPGALAQAKDYAKHMDISLITCPYSTEGENIGEVYLAPFIFATNGRPYLKQLKDKSGIIAWDARNPDKPAHVLEAFLSPKDITQKLIVNEREANFALEEERMPDFADRYYQKEAIEAVERGIKENKRRMLLALATGTGKTRLAIALMYRLIKTKRMRRILFLVDRQALGKQTEDALKDIQVDNVSISDIYSVCGIDQKLPELDTKIHVSTVQGMVRRLFQQEDADKIPSVGTYDFIIVDEAHRGYIEDKEMSEDEIRFRNQEDYVSQYRRVIDYFDATVVALTATPALHTTQIFGDPIYSYTYPQAVVDGYLVDHEPPILFETELSKKGIHFDKGSIVDVWDPETKKIDKIHLQDDLDFDVESFNSKVLTEEFNKVILDTLAQYILPDQPGKTLIFAANDNHADTIVRLLKDAYYQLKLDMPDGGIEKITGSIAHQDLMIRRFKNEEMPKIAVTVDLLTTGIDVPEIVNLVFMRRVKSRILYDQMLGRATRLCPKIKKSAFRIYDAVFLYDYLKEVTDMNMVAKNPNRPIQEVVEQLEKSATPEEESFLRKELLAKLQRKKQTLSDKDYPRVEKLLGISSVDEWLRMLTKSGSSLKEHSKDILAFANYKLYRKPVIISNKKDEIIGIKRGYGTDAVRPQDYLEAFTAFVKDNREEVEAIRLAATRPQDLTYKDLQEIRVILEQHNYDTNSLTLAWNETQKTALKTVDLINFIQYAIHNTPVSDITKRIEEAMSQIYAMHPWSPLQRQWLERLEAQAKKNMILAPTAQTYFDNTDIWKREGGYKRFSTIFPNQLDSIISTLNQHIFNYV